jgi:hypothetical protein
MKALRAVLIATLVLAAATTPALLRSSNGSTGGLTAYAATLVTGPLGARSASASNQNEQNQNNSNSNNNSNDNDQNNNDNNNNGNANNNGNDNNTNGNDNNNNGNDNHMSSPPASPRQVDAPPQAATCSTPGQDITFTSSDGRVSVHVFPSMAQSVKITILSPIDSASVPPPPGQKVDNLLFQVIAEGCNGGPIPALAAEVNLGVHYTDTDASGMNEANFTLARLDTTANQWKPAQKQANDPAGNFVSATITEMGYYAVYQRS